MFDTYTQRVGKEPDSLRFYFENARILDSATPAMLGMEDEDSIDALAAIIAQITVKVKSEEGNQGKLNSVYHCAFPLPANSCTFNSSISIQQIAVIFKVQKSTACKMIFDAYLQRVGQEPGSLGFSLGNRRLLETETLEALGVEDDATIDASQLKMIVKIKSADTEEEGMCRRKSIAFFGYQMKLIWGLLRL